MMWRMSIAPEPTWSGVVRAWEVGSSFRWLSETAFCCFPFVSLFFSSFCFLLSLSLLSFFFFWELVSLLCSSDSYYIISLKLIKSPIEEQSNSEKLWIMELWKYKCQELMPRSNFKNYQIIKNLGSYFLMKKDCVSFC